MGQRSSGEGPREPTFGRFEEIVLGVVDELSLVYTDIDLAVRPGELERIVDQVEQRLLQQAGIRQRLRGVLQDGLDQRWGESRVGLQQQGDGAHRHTVSGPQLPEKISWRHQKASRTTIENSTTDSPFA